jgi:hypothetical protein
VNNGHAVMARAIFTACRPPSRDGAPDRAGHHRPERFRTSMKILLSLRRSRHSDFRRQGRSTHVRETSPPDRAGPRNPSALLDRRRPRRGGRPGALDIVSVASPRSRKLGFYLRHIIRIALAGRSKN